MRLPMMPSPRKPTRFTPCIRQCLRWLARHLWHTPGSSLRLVEMKFPGLFKREKSSIAAREAQERAEKLLAESFRVLSQVCIRMADFIETQRLQRAGYEPQEKYLERLDKQRQASERLEEKGRPEPKD